MSLQLGVTEMSVSKQLEVISCGTAFLTSCRDLPIWQQLQWKQSGGTAKQQPDSSRLDKFKRGIFKQLKALSIGFVVLGSNSGKYLRIILTGILLPLN